MKVGLVVRVSDLTQAGPMRSSLETQEQLLRGMAERNGWEVVKVYEIPGESAYADELSARPLFRAAVDAACRREFDALLVTEFSRFSRDEEVAHHVLNRLRKAGCKLIGLNGVDYIAQRAMASIEGLMAAQASRDHAFRVSNGLRGQFDRGMLIGDLPFGYRRVMAEDARGAVAPNTKVPPVVVQEEAEAIRWAFAHYVRNGSPMEIAEEFNRRGLRPRSKRGRLLFEASTVQSLLENKAYAGWVTYHQGRPDEETREGQHEAIVTAEEWAAVQDRTERKVRASRSQRLLSGLLVCVWCKRLLTTETGADRYVERRRMNEPCATHGKIIRTEVAHAGIVEAVAALSWDGETEWAAWVTKRARRPAPVSTSATEAKALDAQRVRVVKAYQLGGLTDREFEHALSDIKSRKAQAEPVRDNLRFAAERVASFGQVWMIANEAARREALRIILECAEVDLATGTVWLRPRPEFAELASARRDYIEAGGGFGTPDWCRTSRIHLERAASGLFLPSELVAA